MDKSHIPQFIPRVGKTRTVSQHSQHEMLRWVGFTDAQCIALLAPFSASPVTENGQAAKQNGKQE